MSERAVHDGPVSEGGAVTKHQAAPGAIDVSLIPRDLTPEQLIYVAIQQGVSPDSLEKLVLLQERMDKTRAMKAFNQALVDFKSRCPAIKKNRTANIKTDGGGSYSFTYAEIDEIALVADPYLEEVGLSYIWNQDATKEMVKVECVLMHRDGHQRSSFFTCPAENKSGASIQQKFGGATTFAQRRSLAAVLGLVTTEKDFDSAAVDPTKISEDQETELADLVASTCKGDQATRFLAYMGVEKVGDIRSADYGKAKKSLAKLRQANEKKEEAR